MCVIKQMYKLHVCRYITSVYPSLRYSHCFFGLFSLHHWFSIDSTPEFGCFGLNGPLRHYFSLYRALPLLKQKLLNKQYIGMYVKLENSDAKHSKM